MNPPTPLDDDEHEDLVAYLDGELDEEAARSLETRLNLDASVRAEADSLKRTWDLLDYLPRPEPSPDFTHKTLTKLSTRGTRTALQPGPRVRRWLLRLAWVAGIVATTLTGYALTLKLLPQPSREKELVRDLRLIENLRVYEQVETMDFLRELDRPELFGDNNDP